jgi:glycosyltransferase involved in cell wall biosynthesis
VDGKDTLVDIVITRSNSIIYDPRVRKIARSLSKRYSMLILGWNREGLSKKKLTDNYIVDLKLFNLKAPFGKLSLVAYFPLFWMWILFKLFMYRPKVVHACDLDTVLPCYIYKIIFRRRLVFDVFDRYAMGYIPQFLEPGSPKFKTLYSLVNLFEELFSKEANVLINVSDELLRTFQRRPKYSAIIMNCPEDHVIDRVKSEDYMLTLVYTGNITRNRGLDRIAAAIKDLTNVELVIAGRVVDKELLDHILEISNVKYKGLLQQSDALELEAYSDVMIILYDLKDLINNFAMPNKIFEAMMFGLPIITNVTPELINRVDCGIIVDYNDINQVKAAVVYLKDNIELRRRLGNNGRKAFLQKYNWTMMEQELYKIYGNLLGK